MGQMSSRQEIIATEMSNPRMKNWLSANIAMREASQVLAERIHKKIADMHKNMLKMMGKEPFCQRNCTRFGTNWCSVCERWSRQIIAVCEPNYRSRINWSRFNSSQWASNPYEVARVFIPRAHRLYYKSAEFHEDYRFSLSFLENCYDIPISGVLCERAWTFRGRLKRKNGMMRMGHRELEEGISVMKELVSLPAFGNDNQAVLKRLSLLSQCDSEDSSDGCCIT